MREARADAAPGRADPQNSKSRTTQAVKLVQASHRLILSGTPIQNNVLELWSLFDFLMPGFLGNERQFTQQYSASARPRSPIPDRHGATHWRCVFCRAGKPIQASREAKASSAENEAGTLALEALHRQVLPFLLRRVKEDVLGDLPPKVIQDYYCDLSPLQTTLCGGGGGGAAGGPGG